MLHPPTPEHIELAIELVAYAAGPVRRDAEPTDLLDDLGLDNLHRITIGNEIENRFAVDVPSREIQSWASVRDIAALLATIPGALAA